MLTDRNSLHNESLPQGATIIHSPFLFFSFPSILRTVFVAGAAFFCFNVYAQPGDAKQKEADYKKVITERSAKIINTLNITDSGKYNKVLNDLVNQYLQVNALHDQTKAAIVQIKAQAVPAEEKTESIKKLEEEKYSRLLQLHQQFITHLKESLAEEQLEQVKDGMTYRVFPITYKAYQDMVLNLTGEQKEKIYNWLKEARELAMDEGSSEDKHKVFGKYKGKINNYLSSEGYDMKKEEKGWQERIRKSKKSADGA